MKACTNNRNSRTVTLTVDESTAAYIEEEKAAMRKNLFCEKMAHYASREPNHFLQLDSHDGELYAEGTVELMFVSSVRVLIPHDADHKSAIRQLERLTQWLDKNPDLFGCAQPRPIIMFSDDIPF